MNNIVTGNISSIGNIDATLSPKEQIQGPVATNTHLHGHLLPCFPLLFWRLVV